MTSMIAGFSGQLSYREQADQLGVAVGETQFNRRTDTHIQGHNYHSHDQGTTSALVQPPSLDDNLEADPILDEMCSRAYLSSSSTIYPAFHLPSPFTIAAYRDSDTPSLASSSSSFSSCIAPGRIPPMQNLHSPPVTPAASDHGCSILSVIEEQDLDYSCTSSIESIIFAPPDSDEPPSLVSFTQSYTPTTSSVRSKLFQQSEGSRSDTTTEPLYKLKSSRPSSTDSRASQLRHSKVLTFSRLFSGSSKNLGNGVKMKERDLGFSKTPTPIGKHRGVWEQVLPPLESAQSTTELITNSPTKSDDKRRKKDLAKAKRDQLAAELKAKELKRRAQQDGESVNSKRSQGRLAVSAWEENGSMYNMKGIL